MRKSDRLQNFSRQGGHSVEYKELEGGGFMFTLLEDKQVMLKGNSFTIKINKIDNNSL